MFLLRILLIEDDKIFRNSLKKAMALYGQVTEASTYDEAKSEIANHEFDLVIIDLNLHGSVVGLDLLRMAIQRGFFSIILTDYNNKEFMAKAFELNCSHYLSKDDFETVLHFIVKKRAVELYKLQKYHLIFSNNFITQDQKLQSDVQSILLRSIENKHFLIIGDKGTGKKKLAELISSEICQNTSSFEVVSVKNISIHQITEKLLGKNSEGGRSDNGIINSSNEGIVVIDGIDLLPMVTQIELSKKIDEMKKNQRGPAIFYLGSEYIFEKIQNGTFSPDLLNKINDVMVKIPSLSERKKDIPFLIKYFIGIQKVDIHSAVVEKLVEYSWFGNVKQLKNVITEMITNKEKVTIEDLPSYIINNVDLQNDFNEECFIPDNHFSYIRQHGYKKYLEKVELEGLREIAKKVGHNRIEVKNYMKIPKATFYRMLSRHGDTELGMTC